MIGVCLVVLHTLTSLLGFRRSSRALGLCYVVVKVCFLQGCGTGFNDFVDPDPDWESGSRIRIQVQKNEEK
jgi:hypothetical protein